MKEPPEADGSTRPISVAELLARNGSIGAPPVGGRRRRRRGNSDAVTVAELTGEIPIVTDDTETTHSVPTREPVEEESVAEPVPEDAELPEPPSDGQPEPEPEDEDGAPAAPASTATEAEADYATHLEQRDAEPDLLDFAPPPNRPTASTPTGSATGAELMSPDPDVDDELVDLGSDVDFNEVLDKHASSDDDQPVPSYLRSSSDTLFGGQSVADDLARRGLQPRPEDIDLGHEDADPSEPVAEGSAFVRGLWVVAQCILAVAFGAGLFIAFDQLWRWNIIVALVLSVLVILGLVVGVRVVRKTEDIGSTLIAVAVGALVTLGPLALLQSN